MRRIRLAIARAKEGDREAIRLLYIHYSGNVYGYIRSLVRDDAEAEDLTQQIFLKLFAAIGRYTDRGVPFSAWLLRLARNAALDHLRKRHPELMEDVGHRDEQDEHDLLEQVSDVRAALRTLPLDQRRVVFLRHVMGLTPREIALQIGRTESSVHGLHHRGRRALQRELLRLDVAPATAGCQQSQRACAAEVG